MKTTMLIAALLVGSTFTYTNASTFAPVDTEPVEATVPNNGPNTDPLAIEEVKETKLTVISTPNRLAVDFRAEEMNAIKIKMYDMMGRIVIDDKIDAFGGRYVKEYPFDGFLKGGVYVAVVGDEYRQVTKKFQVR